MTKVKMTGTLVGQDGNAFALMGYFQQQAMANGWTQDEINEELEKATSGDYYNLISVLESWFNPPEDFYLDQEYEDRIMGDEDI